MNIRQGTPGDHEAAIEVYRAAQAARGQRPSSARLARISEKLADDLLVVADDGNLIGLAVGEPGRADDGAGDVIPGLLHVSMVFVHPDRQRQGVGAALVEGLADAGWGAGFRSVSLWTRTPEFYEACGLERSGREQEGGIVQLTAELEAPMREIVLHETGIRLGQLLKLAEVVDTGAEAKDLLAAGGVEVNGEVELRRGRQMQDGDEVRANDQAIHVTIPEV
jgi:ribosome-associated protein YbcJ (S4-like RNA binding protein)/GNAT superfamily N-acetyltransferase